MSLIRMGLKITKLSSYQLCLLLTVTSVTIILLLYQREQPVNKTEDRELFRLRNKSKYDLQNSSFQDTQTNHVTVFDLSQDSSDPSQCYPLKVESSAVVCVYKDAEDRWVSQNLHLHGTFEPSIEAIFKQALKHDPELDVIDIGANLGLYSLIAAAMGRKVISVEPLQTNINRFHKSVKVNKFEDRITLITNAVSNKRSKVYLKTNRINHGATRLVQTNTTCDDVSCPSTWSVLMDDILPAVIDRGINRAVMKIDIEGAEHLAFANATRLFSTIQIPLIFMETNYQKQFCGVRVPQTEDERLSNAMFAFLKQQGFTRVFTSDVNGRSLDPEACSDQWPFDVIWVHHSQTFPP